MTLPNSGRERSFEQTLFSGLGPLQTAYQTKDCGKGGIWDLGSVFLRLSFDELRPPANLTLRVTFDVIHPSAPALSRVLRIFCAVADVFAHSRDRNTVSAIKLGSCSVESLDQCTFARNFYFARELNQLNDLADFFFERLLREPLSEFGFHFFGSFKL